VLVAAEVAHTAPTRIELEALEAEELGWVTLTLVEETELLILALALVLDTTIAVLLELAAQEL
jgi:hypothetical protein